SSVSRAQAFRAFRHLCCRYHRPFAGRCLMSSTSVSGPQIPFWQRQFLPEPSWAQNAFDVAAGILLPVLCLVADPIVFRGQGFGAPFLGSIALLAYATIGVSILAITLWLVCRRPPGFLAGFLFSGALFALLLGIFLLPLSLVGLFAAGMGILGL